MSEEYKKFLNWCEDKWEHDYKMQKLLSKLSNDDKDFLKDQYEARLKADMVAILTELQLEIEESENCGKAFHLGLQMASNIIQQKINALEEQTDGNNRA